jgi:hypothetical protein
MAGKSFFDQAKELGLKARDTLAKNSDKVDDGIDKAADFIDSKTKGKYNRRIAKVKSAAHGALEKLDDTSTAGTDRPDTGDTRPADPPAARPDPGAPRPADADADPGAVTDPPAPAEPPAAPDRAAAPEPPTVADPAHRPDPG